MENELSIRKKLKQVLQAFEALPSDMLHMYGASCSASATILWIASETAERSVGSGFLSVTWSHHLPASSLGVCVVIAQPNVTPLVLLLQDVR